jgi:Zn-dependent protease with chaperone function
VTGASLFAGYVMTAGVLAPAALRRTWASRAPRLALGLWLVLSLSWIAAISLAVLAAATPFALTWSGSGADAVTSHATGLLAADGAGLLLAAAAPAWAAVCVAGGLTRARRERRAHAAFLETAGRPDQTLGAVIVDHNAPAAYSLPDRCHRIVISTGTLAALGPAQLQAVLAHERAHLRGRHHLLVATASAMQRAFPFVPLLAQAATEVAILAEMAADDAAAGRHEPADLAAALVILATARSRPAVLTASGPAATARIQRLLSPPCSQGRPTRIARLAAGAAALALPTTIACLPLIAAACGVASQT